MRNVEIIIFYYSLHKIKLKLISTFRYLKMSLEEINTFTFIVFIMQPIVMLTKSQKAITFMNLLIERSRFSPLVWPASTNIDHIHMHHWHIEKGPGAHPFQWLSFVIIRSLLFSAILCAPGLPFSHLRSTIYRQSGSRVWDLFYFLFSVFVPTVERPNARGPDNPYKSVRGRWRRRWRRRNALPFVENNPSLSF